MKNEKTRFRDIANKRICFMLDFIATARFQIIWVVVLLALGTLFFYLSTRVVSPELKEFRLTVDERTTSHLDTVFMELLLIVSKIQEYSRFKK